MNCQSLWLDCSQAHRILCLSPNLIFLFSIPSHNLLPSQASLLEHPDSPTILCEPFRTHSHFSCSIYSSSDSPSYICDPLSILTFMISGCWLSSSGVSLLRLFPFLRACTERGTFIDNHMRWSEQGLLWGIDSGDYGHYFTSWALCSRT